MVGDDLYVHTSSVSLHSWGFTDCMYVGEGAILVSYSVGWGGWYECVMLFWMNKIGCMCHSTWRGLILQLASRSAVCFLCLYFWHTRSVPKGAALAFTLAMKRKRFRVALTSLFLAQWKERRANVVCNVSVWPCLLVVLSMPTPRFEKKRASIMTGWSLPL